MKIKLLHLAYTMLVFATLTLLLPVNTMASGNINWYSYKEGMVTGRIEKKKVFLHFYANWCGYCRKMAKDTFQDPSVVSYLNENFIAIRVDFDKENEIASRYGVRGLPSTWFLTQTGERIGNVPGYIPPKSLLLMLKEVQLAKSGNL
jgi:thioredoxin-related protein